jgi:chemotaxis protein histidine kinase CheA
MSRKIWETLTFKERNKLRKRFPEDYDTWCNRFDTTTTDYETVKRPSITERVMAPVHNVTGRVRQLGNNAMQSMRHTAERVSDTAQLANAKLHQGAQEMKVKAQQGAYELKNKAQQGAYELKNKADQAKYEVKSKANQMRSTNDRYYEDRDVYDYDEQDYDYTVSRKPGIISRLKAMVPASLTTRRNKVDTDYYSTNDYVDQSSYQDNASYDDFEYQGNQSRIGRVDRAVQPVSSIDSTASSSTVGSSSFPTINTTSVDVGLKQRKKHKKSKPVAKIEQTTEVYAPTKQEALEILEQTREAQRSDLLGVGNKNIVTGTD